MPMQSLCHARNALAAAGALVFCSLPSISLGDAKAHDYPTHARVEYVQECIAQSGARLANLYQCSCVIDEIAKRYTYDEFVEASTFSKYATLPGERGGLFRDPEYGKKMAKEFRAFEKEASKRCGIKH